MLSTAMYYVVYKWMFADLFGRSQTMSALVFLRVFC